MLFEIELDGGAAIRAEVASSNLYFTKQSLVIKSPSVIAAKTREEAWGKGFVLPSLVCDLKIEIPRHVVREITQLTEAP